jgi:molybdopterin/thiamine biosynthesis adenylyltransferase
VLIAPANGPNTELAKNLILAGVNVTIYDHATVTEDDFESNFLIAHDDIGKSRGEAVFEKLKEMNPSGKNEFFCQNLLEEVERCSEEEFKRYSMVATSTADFAVMQKWDAFTKKMNLPYYNLLSCGLFACAFISLGRLYTYREIDKQTNEVKKQWSIRPLELEEAVEWQQAEKNKEFVAAIRSICYDS